MEQEDINRETDEMDDNIEDTDDHTMEKNGRIKNIYTKKGVEEVVTKVLDDKNKPIPRRRTKMMDDITTGDTNVTDNSDNEAIEAVDSDGNELNKNKRRIKTTTKVTDSEGNEVLGSGSELNEDLNESELDELEQLIELMGVKNERIEELEMALQESVKMMTEKEKDLDEEEERRRAIMEKVELLEQKLHSVQTAQTLRCASCKPLLSHLHMLEQRCERLMMERLKLEGDEANANGPFQTYSDQEDKT